MKDTRSGRIRDEHGRVLLAGTPAVHVAARSTLTGWRLAAYVGA